jgi:hypothetical protein
MPIRGSVARLKVEREARLSARGTAAVGIADGLPRRDSRREHAVYVLRQHIWVRCKRHRLDTRLAQRPEKCSGTVGTFAILGVSPCGGNEVDVGTAREPAVLFESLRRRAREGLREAGTPGGEEGDGRAIREAARFNWLLAVLHHARVASLLPRRSCPSIDCHGEVPVRCTRLCNERDVPRPRTQHREGAVRVFHPVQYAIDGLLVVCRVPAVQDYLFRVEAGPTHVDAFRALEMHQGRRRQAAEVRAGAARTSDEKQCELHQSYHM